MALHAYMTIAALFWVFMMMEPDVDMRTKILVSTIGAVIWPLSMAILIALLLASGRKK